MSERQKVVDAVVVAALGSDSLEDHREHTASVVVVLLVPEPEQTRPYRQNRPEAMNTNRETVGQGTLSHHRPQKVRAHFAGAGRDSPGVGAVPDSVAGAGAPAHRLDTAPAVDRQKQTLLKVNIQSEAK